MRRIKIIPTVLVVGVVLISAIFLFSTVNAKSPPLLEGARLIEPSAGSVISGAVPFEADLADGSPDDDTVVAFTIYRKLGGAPEEGRFCFLSPTATHVSGTDRWRVDSVDTTKVTGNCSSSLVGWGTVFVPEDGTYRFGLWVDGTEYVTEQEITVENGVITPEEPTVNRNTNTDTNQNSNSGTNNSNTNLNTGNINTNSGGNVNTNQNTNTPVNSGGLATNANTNTGATNNTNSQPPENSQLPEEQSPSISFLKPSSGATVSENVEVAVAVDNAPNIQEVVYSVYSRSVWYTIGRASASGTMWSLSWDTRALPDGVVYGVMRAYLTDGRIYASEIRQFTIANSGAEPTNENENTNVSPPGSSNTNIPPDGTDGVSGPPVPDTDNDGISDEEEIIRGTDPHVPGVIVRRGRTFTLLPASQPISSGDTDDTIRVVKVIGPGIVTDNDSEEIQEQYIFSGVGLPLDYLSLFVYSDNPFVAPVQVNGIGTWITPLNVQLETGEHTAYVAVVNNKGKVVRKSQPFAFTVDPDALKRSQKIEIPWLWIGIGAAVLAGLVTGGFFFMRKAEKGVKGE
ncbi:MAG: hypothetical protein A2898_01755 [Candidatus Kerfeldbacteria bacterium RIFCSPLOWO2_01_FULL_48_11]|uniref:Bacterial Ig-like domain-containing protein n=1 Tax=Candidatus Kerfeldbacteria bacterium RIFCSPLOWO2_01_FULL_48_11 TaxID=1798543 RepID=A0A1G2B6V2_9BACT|nr:MAG: hypothetical protein UY52_C0021G0002 [Parcubacteria group bacterium GW2011_GWC2_49_9]OGY83980.1 MAG: hypothetical protein A2898_01755 [Candidatus Kerfeldbacteria bacterium RIFCSPLOWO2_01_FULL_48_11]HCJ52640.1 hypothetical protein [Candidatus Kerfeldbacteria bacterium]